MVYWKKRSDLKKKNGSHLEKSRTSKNGSHFENGSHLAWKNGSNLEESFILGKMGHTLKKKGATLGKKVLHLENSVQLRKVAHTVKNGSNREKCVTPGKRRSHLKKELYFENGSHLENWIKLAKK